MRIDPRKKVRTVAGENIVIMTDGDAADMTKVVALNESSMLLYDTLKDKDFTVEEAVQALMENYDVDEATARRDVDEWVASMRKQGLILNA